MKIKHKSLCTSHHVYRYDKRRNYMLCSSLDKIIEIFNLRQFSVYGHLCYCHSISIVRLKILCKRFTIILHKIELQNCNEQKPIDHQGIKTNTTTKYKEPTLLVEYTFFALCNQGLVTYLCNSFRLTSDKFSIVK